jgi:hypothetical protein
LVGAWPLDGSDDFETRVTEHLVKAAREAKVHTEWLEPDSEHEAALTGFARNLLADEEFIADIEAFGEPVWRAGALDSLAHTMARICSPGVPDIDFALRSELALLADLGPLPDEVAEVVQLGAAHIAPPDDLELGDGRGVERERALDADAVAQLAHGVGLVQATTLAGDHIPLEHLDTLFATLDDADVHLDLVTRCERGKVVT